MPVLVIPLFEFLSCGCVILALAGGFGRLVGCGRSCRGRGWLPGALALAVALLAPGWATAQLAGHDVEASPDLAPILDATGFGGTVLVYDLQADRLQALHPERVDERRIPASTFKILNSMVALETGVVADEHTVIPWDGVVRFRAELNRDLDLATAFRLSAVPHFQRLARSIGPERMQRFVDSLGYGNRDIGGGIDRFWLEGDLRISPREQIELLVRLYRDELPVSPRSMAVVRTIMEMERHEGMVLRGKTGWAALPGGHQVGWWVGWVERGADVFFFASMIEADDPGAGFGAARTEVARRVLRRLGILDPVGGSGS